MKYVCERLNQDHIIEWFDCGYGNSLGQWLIDHGRQFQDRFQSQIWVMCPQGTSEVVGYFSLSSHMLEPNLLRRKIRDGIPSSVSHPAQLLGKFAIDTSVQGTGASDSLMFHVLGAGGRGFKSRYPDRKNVRRLCSRGSRKKKYTTYVVF